MKVQNQFPNRDPGPVRLAIVGDAPSKEDASWTVCIKHHEFAGLNHNSCPVCCSTDLQPKPTPFTGMIGRLLKNCLSLSRHQIWLGNLFDEPMTRAELEAMTLEQLQERASKLRKELEPFNPNCVLLLGNVALAAFHPRGKVAKIGEWRGSVWEDGCHIE